MSSRRSSSRFHLLPSLTTHSPLSLIGGMTPGAGRHVTKESQGMELAWGISAKFEGFAGRASERPWTLRRGFFFRTKVRLDMKLRLSKGFKR